MLLPTRTRLIGSLPFVDSCQLNPTAGDRGSPLIGKMINLIQRFATRVAAFPRSFDVLSNQSRQILDRIGHRSCSLTAGAGVRVPVLTTESRVSRPSAPNGRCRRCGILRSL